MGKGSLVSSNRAAQYAPAWKGNLDAEVHIIGVSAPASERVHGLPRCLTLPPAFSFHCSPSVPVGFSRLRHVEAKCDSSDGDQGVKSATVTAKLGPEVRDTYAPAHSVLILVAGIAAPLKVL